MKEVLKFDIKANGGLSAVPYLCQFFSAIFAGQFADFLRSRQILSTTLTRKSFQTFAFAGAGGCLIGTGFCDCEHRTLAVTLLSLAVMFTGFGRAGYVVNHVDFAPKYAGVLFGITNTIATIPGMTAPLLAGYLTPNNTPEEWRNVFYVCAGFDAFGILIFCIFGSGEMQDWARDEDFEADIQVGTTDNDETKTTSLEDEHVETTIDSTTQNINYGFEEQKENTNL
ncbi:sialin-like [Ruditapes philippinarum]|uniref:sialin-like n=1 Tax=Ruditapes philippinarum TaxID=129788 RepID=UPI00295A5AD4|nr:sialin-like [Ruditapes philippinarum]